MPTAPRRPQAHRKRQQLQARRLRAVELLTAGIHPAEVARQLGHMRGLPRQPELEMHFQRDPVAPRTRPG